MNQPIERVGGPEPLPSGADAGRERLALLASLFDEAIAVACADPDLESPRPWAEETALVARGSPARLREFRAGRACARLALRGLAEPEAAVMRGARGEPLWSPVVVGSITHTDGFCAAAVGRRSDYVGLGVDAEPDIPVSRDFARRVCSAAELSCCTELGETELFARIVFSAKESVYKLQYPLTGAVLYWRDIRVALSAQRPQGRTQRGHFNAHLPTSGPPTSTGPISNALTLNGSWVRGAGLILTGISLKTFAIETV